MRSGALLVDALLRLTFAVAFAMEADVSRNFQNHLGLVLLSCGFRASFAQPALIECGIHHASMLEPNVMRIESAVMQIIAVEIPRLDVAIGEVTLIVAASRLPHEANDIVFRHSRIDSVPAGSDERHLWMRVPTYQLNRNRHHHDIGFSDAARSRCDQRRGRCSEERCSTAKA